MILVSLSCIAYVIITSDKANKSMRPVFAIIQRILTWFRVGIISTLRALHSGHSNLTRLVVHESLFTVIVPLHCISEELCSVHGWFDDWMSVHFNWLNLLEMIRTSSSTVARDRTSSAIFKMVGHFEAKF